MTMIITRDDTVREAAWEYSEGIWPASREELTARLRSYRRAVEPRAYLWFGVVKGLIELHEANAMLGEIREPHWACWWIPDSWLRENPPSLISETNVRLFVLPERLRLLPSFPEDWFDEV